MRVHYTFFSVRLWSNERWRLLFQPLFAFNQLRQQRLILGELLLLIVYDLLGRSRDERFIRELAFKHRNLLEAVFLLLRDSCKFLFKVDKLGKRHKQSRRVRRDLDKAVISRGSLRRFHAADLHILRACKTQDKRLARLEDLGLRRSSLPGAREGR